MMAARSDSRFTIHSLVLVLILPPVDCVLTLPCKGEQEDLSPSHWDAIATYGGGIMPHWFCTCNEVPPSYLSTICVAA